MISDRDDSLLMGGNLVPVITSKSGAEGSQKVREGPTQLKGHATVVMEETLSKSGSSND